MTEIVLPWRDNPNYQGYQLEPGVSLAHTTDPIYLKLGHNILGTGPDGLAAQQRGIYWIRNLALGDVVQSYTVIGVGHREAEIGIGTNRNHMQLDGTASHKHVRLAADSERLYLVDAGSTNGTLVYATSADVHQIDELPVLDYRPRHRQS